MRKSTQNILLTGVTKHTLRSQKILLTPTAKLEKVFTGMLFVFGLTCFSEN